MAGGSVISIQGDLEEAGNPAKTQAETIKLLVDKVAELVDAVNDLQGRVTALE